MDYNEVFRELYLQKVEYLLCGGLAVNIYGIPRMTADIDVLLNFEEVNINSFKAVIQKFGYSPALPLNLSEMQDEAKRVYYKNERNLIAYSFVSLQRNQMTVDVLIDTPINFNLLWDRKETRKTTDYEMYIVSVEDLINLKKHANRVQDQKDVILLSQLLKQ